MKHSGLRSPITWFGGKGRLTHWLLEYMPPHDKYVEVFGGGASLLFAKPPCTVEVYNDIDGDLVNLFRVIRDPEQFEEFRRLVALTPYSREEFHDCANAIINEEDFSDPVKRAWQFFVVARMCGSTIDNKSWLRNISSAGSFGGMSVRVGNWLAAIEALPDIHQRTMVVQIEHLDWKHILDTYNLAGYLAYLDPPYVTSVRRSGGYKYEMIDQDHIDLVETVLQYPQMVMLSGYANDIYVPLEKANWKRIDKDVPCSATITKGKGATYTQDQRRTESLWLNPKAWEALQKGKEQLQLF